jgi:aminopeptidase N
MKTKLFFIPILFFSLCQSVFSQNILEKDYDVKQYILDLQISNSSRYICGNVTINANVTTPQLETFVTELIDTLVPDKSFMFVDSVFVNDRLNAFTHLNEEVRVSLEQPILQNHSFSVKIFYHGIALGPNGGVALYKINDTSHTCSWSEPYYSKIWWPCKQDLTDKADSVIFYITTDSTNKTGSNGILKSTEILPYGKVKYKWETKYPISYYLISFVVAPFAEIENYIKLKGENDSLLIKSLVFDYPNLNLHERNLAAIYSLTPKLLNLYSSLLGEYPFKKEKYGFCIVGQQSLAMEHQTMCTMGYNTMDTTPSTVGEGQIWYVAHETAHQWFGDYVTCAAWNYIWLHEGFASYMEYVALQNLQSQKLADTWMKNAHYLGIMDANGMLYIPDSLTSNDAIVFDNRNEYKKGASILHMLRYETNNDSLFFAILKNYLSKFAYSVATVDDFKQVAETTTGNDLTVFFNQWYYGKGYPTFHINWDQTDDTLIIVSNQTTSSSKTPLFKTHFDLKLTLDAGDTIIRLYQESNEEKFELHLSKKVISIEFDPGLWLLQKKSIIIGIQKTNDDEMTAIFPNPAKNELRIRTLNAKSTISIFNVTGKMVLSKQFFYPNELIDINRLSAGIYIIKARNAQGVQVLKFVKE